MSKNWPKSGGKNFPRSWNNTCEDPEAGKSKFQKLEGQCSEGIRSQREKGRRAKSHRPGKELYYS